MKSKKIIFSFIALSLLLTAECSRADTSADNSADPSWVRQRINELQSVQGSLQYLADGPEYNQVANYLDFNAVNKGLDRVISLVSPAGDAGVTNALYDLKAKFQVCGKMDNKYHYTFGMGVNPDCYMDLLAKFDKSKVAAAIAALNKKLPAKPGDNDVSAKMKKLTDQYAAAQRTLDRYNSKITEMQTPDACKLASTNQSENSPTRRDPATDTPTAQPAGSTSKAIAAPAPK